MEATATVSRSELARLELEREATIEKLEHLKLDLRNTAERSPDEADTDTYEREKILALAHSLERKLESIDRAIESAQNGTYGVCESCSQRIDPARLEILPQATLCLRCQRAYELKARKNRR
jgi:RNA polymerase-binding protein DksA